MRLRHSKILACVTILGALAACSERPTAPSGDAVLARSTSGSQGMIGINVLTTAAPTAAMLRELGAYGNVFDVMTEINAVIMIGKADQLDAIRALRFVASADPDGEVTLDPTEAATVTAFTGGMSMWNLDAVNATSGPGTNVHIAQTGRGVYVGVIDTGLLPSWRAYFPAERIASEYATAFVGGGAASQGATPSPTGFWENDQNTHGTHVTSTILGFSLFGTAMTGVAPEATVIPVKVLNQNGSGWWSAIAQGIMHIARLKTGALAGSPMVINMSLGSGPGAPTTGVLKAAIDYAISKGVIIVAAAGNEGEAGMGSPGSYAPVISVASVGFRRQFTTANWWYALDLAEPTSASEFYISGSSSRAKGTQDLDVAAPGVAILGPAQSNSGHLEYQFFTGTSMATPHVTGTVALMLQKNPGLRAGQVESILETSGTMALPPAVAPNCPIISPGVGFAPVTRCWNADATGAGVVQVDKALAATPTGK